MTRSGAAEAQTESQDVSSRGIYFFLPNRIEKGSPVEILISLPHDVALEGRPRVLCRGHIQRTEVVKPDRIGVAARFESYEFVHASENEFRSSATQA